MSYPVLTKGFQQPSTAAAISFSPVPKATHLPWFHPLYWHRAYKANKHVVPSDHTNLKSQVHTNSG